MCWHWAPGRRERELHGEQLVTPNFFGCRKIVGKFFFLSENFHPKVQR